MLVLAASGLAGLLYKFNFCHIRNLRVRSTAQRRCADMYVVVCAGWGWCCVAMLLAGRMDHVSHHTHTPMPVNGKQRVMPCTCRVLHCLTNLQYQSRCWHCTSGSSQLTTHCNRMLCCCSALFITCCGACCCTLQLPSPLVQAVSRLLGPLLTDPRSSGPSVILVGATPSGPAAPAAAQQSDAHAFAEGFYGGGAVPRHRGPLAGSAEADVGRPAAGAAAPTISEPSEEALEKLLAMGFTRERAAQALQQSNNNLEVAIALLLG